MPNIIKDINRLNLKNEEIFNQNNIMNKYKDIIFSKITNKKDKSKLMDKYLIPQELEKKSNAEVSMPYKLRQEMLDKIPIDFFFVKFLKKSINIIIQIF